MIGLVVVSHSAKLAEGVCDLARQISQGRVPLVAAGGVYDPIDGAANNGLGTDVLKVVDAIESVYSDDGVLVLMDLGSAVLSAEMALEMLPACRRAMVRLSAAPLVEGTVAAVVLALAGGDLDQVSAEAAASLTPKSVQLGISPPVPPLVTQPVSAVRAARETTAALRNALGLHARPAAQIVALAASYRADLRVRRLGVPGDPVSARSLTGLLSLGARQGATLALSAQGPDGAAALAALSRLIEGGFGEAARTRATLAPATSTDPPPHLPGGVILGIGAAPGIAIGPARMARPARPSARYRVSERFANAAPTDAEIASERLLEAIADVRDDVLLAREQVRRRLGEDQGAILDAQILFLEDPALVEAALQHILDQTATAEMAWRMALESVLARYADGVASDRREPAALPDYLQSRVSEFGELGQQVLQRLAWGDAEHAGQAVESPVVGATIWVGRDISPAECARLDPAAVLGVCTEVGSPNSHSAIFVRALGIPMVVGLGDGFARSVDGATVALDGDQGRVWAAPDAATVAALGAEQHTRRRTMESTRAAACQPAVTLDGRSVRVLANIGGLPDVGQALGAGAEGVGVLRTEFLYLNRSTAPSEEEQYTLYAEIAARLGDRPLVIRTLDIGGDKPLPYLHVEPEANPFLGWRGIRVGLAQPEMLKTQLRAILRVSALAPGRLTILLPMVADLADIRIAKGLLSDAQSELRRSDVPFDQAVAFGVMVEVPSAVAVADQLAANVDYLSIGTNDLCQYALAADRTNPRVAALADSFHPAVLRFIRQVALAAQGAGIRVGVCGEFASDPQAVPLLLGLDIDELSMTAAAIPGIKSAIAGCRWAACRTLAAEALAADSARAVHGLVRTYLAQRED